MNPLTALTPQAPAHAADAARAAEPKPTAEMVKVAREFESIFLRALLTPLEKATKMSGNPMSQAGQSAYGGMVVGAMADSMSASGGIGLAEVIAKAMAQHQSSGKETPKP